MALTTQEKDLLRQALCDGAFNNIHSLGKILPRLITSDVLERVSLMSDDEIRAVLSTYKNNKLTEINRKIALVNDQNSKLKAELNSLTT